MAKYSFEFKMEVVQESDVFQFENAHHIFSIPQQSEICDKYYQSVFRNCFCISLKMLLCGHDGDVQKTTHQYITKKSKKQ